MYTLNEYLPIFVGDDLPEKGWNGGMYCMETDAVKILRTNLMHGFVSCFAFMLVDKGWMTVHYCGRELAFHPDDLYTYSHGLPITVIATYDLTQEQLDGFRREVEEMTKKKKLKMMPESMVEHIAHLQL